MFEEGFASIHLDRCNIWIDAILGAMLGAIMLGAMLFGRLSGFSYSDFSYSCFRYKVVVGTKKILIQSSVVLR